MTRRYQSFQVDAFATARFHGNPAGVVFADDALTELEMQSIAREFNNSETAFVLPPDAGDHDVRIRFFTPTMEVPSCGHATIAAHFTRVATGRGWPGPVVHKIGAGLLPIEVAERDGRIVVAMTQRSPDISNPLPAARRAGIAAALSLTSGDLDDSLPVQWVDTGHSKILVPLRSRDALDRARPHIERLNALHAEIPNAGVYLFSTEGPDPGVTAHARMFAPQIGILEDPVTGNGAGPLGAYLTHHRRIPVRNGRAQCRIVQGEVIGRPGTVDVSVAAGPDGPTGVQIAGSAVMVFETEFVLD